MTRRLLAGAVGLTVAGSMALSACGNVSATKLAPTAATSSSAESATSAATSQPPTSQPSTSATPAATSTPAAAPTTAATTASTPAPSAPAGTQPKAALARIVLRSTDLPASWRATPAHPDSGSAKSDAELAKCVGQKATTADQVAEVDSDDFTLQTYTVSSSATRYKSQADVDSDVALLKRPKIAACFKAQAVRELGGSLPAGSKLGAVSVVVKPGSNGGASNVAGTLHATIAVTVQAQKATIYVDSVFITGPRTEAEVDFEGVGTPVSAALQARLTKIVAQRCAQR